MKSLFTLLLLASCCLFGYSYYKYPDQTISTCKYVTNTAIEKTCTWVKDFCNRESASTEIGNAPIKHTTNLYKVEYAIIDNGTKHPVSVTTYGYPNMIRVGNRYTLIYEFPDGGQYKITTRDGTKIKIKSIEKIC